MVYTRSNTKRQSTAALKINAALTASETSRLPALVPDMSLWGTAPNSVQESTHNEPLHSSVAQLSTGRRFMSLEEVEAQILAMNQKPSAPSLVHNFQSQSPLNQQVAHHFQHQILRHTPSPGAQLPQFAALPMDLRGFPAQKLSQHVQQVMQQQTPQHPQQLTKERIVAPQPTLQQLRDHETIIPPQGRNQYGMTTHLPAQHLQSMTEVDRLRFLEEESKRLKRNHKIAQLVGCRYRIDK